MIMSHLFDEDSCTAITTTRRKSTLEWTSKNFDDEFPHSVTTTTTTTTITTLHTSNPQQGNRSTRKGSTPPHPPPYHHHPPQQTTILRGTNQNLKLSNNFPITRSVDLNERGDLYTSQTSLDSNDS